MKTDGSERFNVFGRRWFKVSQSNFQLHRSLGGGGGGGGEFNFLTPLIRNFGTPYVLKICTMFINMLYKRIAC